MDYNVRTGPLADLAETLRRFASDRLSHGKAERAAEASAAAELLERDGVAYFERVYYAVDDEPGDRWSVTIGSREQIEQELEQAGLGWVHEGKTQRAQEAARALNGIEGGATRVRVGHIVYEIRG